MKKLSAVILTIAMLASALAGCTGNVPETTDGITGAVTTGKTAENGTEAADPAAQPFDGSVTALRVNYEKEPDCIDDTPVFSWATDCTVRGTYQKSYRIKVAESEADLKKDELVWDSGRVESGESVNIKYGGALEASKRYFFTVTVENGKGETVTSDVSSFETGLREDGFSGASWIRLSGGGGGSLTGAKWIWNYGGQNHGEIQPGTQYFRYAFDLRDPDKIVSARLCFTADDYGKAYINGETVADKPNVTDGWQSGASVDVVKYLSAHNVIAAYAVNTGVGYAGIIARLAVTYEDGSSVTVVSDGKWKFSATEQNGFEKPDFDDSDWKNPDTAITYGEHPWASNVNFSSNNGASAPMVRCEFTADKKIASARLFATAAGLYAPYINGTKVGDTALDPGKSEYQVRVMYQSYDVTSLVHEGKNAIAAMLGRGWYIGAYSPYGGTSPAFLCKLVIDYEDGSRKTVVTDESWKAYGSGPITYDDIFNGENYDARKELPGWSDAGFDDSSWSGAAAVTAAELGIGKVTAQLSGQVRVMDTVQAKERTNPSKNTYIYDFGQNLTGVVRIKVKGNAGQTVTLRHGEMLNDGNAGSDGPAGTLYTTNLRTAQATDRYTLKGDENGETYTPTFTYHGFRYVEITGLKEPLECGDVTALVLYSDMEDTGKIETSDELINQLVSNTYWGQRGNFLSNPTDCPQRDERMGWSGDAQIFCGTAAYNMNVKAFFDKYITDLNDCQRSDGAYTDVAPGANRAQYTGSGNSAWGDAGVIIPWIMYTRYGDMSYIEKYYSNMKRYIKYLVGVSSGYIKRNSAYGDWLSIGENTNMAVTDTAYCVYVCDLMTEMAKLTGNNTDAEKFAEFAKNFREAWRKNFVRKGGILKSDTQTSYVVALRFGILPEEDRAEAAAKLNEKIVKNGNKLTTGFIGVSYLLPVLCEYGYTDTAFKLLQQKEYPSWLYPVLQGATTIWERWNSYTIESGFGNAGMNSFNHYSYGSVTEWMYSYLLGIACEESSPAFKEFTLRPTAGGTLTHVSGSYESMYGTIKSEWKADGGVITEYKCTVPANTTATLYLPAAGVNAVSESGRPLSDSEGLTVVSAENGVLVLRLTCGEYDFQIK